MLGEGPGKSLSQAPAASGNTDDLALHRENIRHVIKIMILADSMKEARIERERGS